MLEPEGMLIPHGVDLVLRACGLPGKMVVSREAGVAFQTRVTWCGHAIDVALIDAESHYYVQVYVGGPKVFDVLTASTMYELQESLQRLMDACQKATENG